MQASSVLIGGPTSSSHAFHGQHQALANSRSQRQILVQNIRLETRRRLLHQDAAKMVESLSTLSQRRIGGKRHALVRGRRLVGAAEATVSAPATPPRPEIKVKDYRVLKITDDTVQLQGRCTERLKFEVEYGLKRGTTDNAYLIRGDEGTALVGVPDQAFSESFVASLAGVTDLTAIQYIVICHLSPKRVESLVQLYRAWPANAPRPQIYCSNPAAQTLAASLPEDGKDWFPKTIVRGGDTLDLGGGHKLEFILTPTPRWPDGMVAYDPATQIIYTHKLFSAHACPTGDFDEGGFEKFGEDWRFFYDCMLGPVPKQTKAALSKLPVVAQFANPSYEGKRGVDIVKADVKFILSSIMSALRLPIDKAAAFSSASADTGSMVVSAIAPLHGPIVRYSVTELIRSYEKWTEDRLKQTEDATIAVIYASAYGNTSALAQAVSRGISKAGVGIETLNCEFATAGEVAAVIKKCNGFVVGSPTLGGHMPTPVQEALGVILSDSEARQKPCGVFGSFGWSGEAVDEIEKKLRDGGFSFAFPSIRCKFKPTEAMLQICEESGTDIAQSVRKTAAKKTASAAPKFTMASETEQAVGRVVGSLCVISARSGDAESAMLASWVSQASFNPPGLTIAVAKDRAVEGLILPGSGFVVNVLGENKYAAISRQLLKPFAPGAPRFGDLETTDSDATGGRILKDAISWMECKVESRMETGDHWVVYASVTNGSLQDEKTLTALHHRKSGTRY